MGAELLVPIAHIKLTTEPGTFFTATGLGDLIISPFILQWKDGFFLGRPFWSRISLGFMLPTGSFDANEKVNTSANAYQFNPYYAFTWEVLPKWEISGRALYLWNSKNLDSSFSAQAGQAIHFNYSVSYEIVKEFRIGPSGYYLSQIHDHKLNGEWLDSRERVLGLGAALHWQSNKTFIRVQGYKETMVKSRPQGTRISISINQIF
ncbi:transporter [Echinicola jeungdonensis]|uniref:SphA family protein n=1 Tax=Echinicola jeungdonensis TaxID=709343 RepID=UPI0025B5B496|nr:transporter [Echinicola jeungdonensis]MDN3668225.1 transporter [Echinicola jeungdonensis]